MSQDQTSRELNEPAGETKSPKKRDSEDDKPKDEGATAASLPESSVQPRKIEKHPQVFPKNSATLRRRFKNIGDNCPWSNVYVIKADVHQEPKQGQGAKSKFPVQDKLKSTNDPGVPEIELSLPSDQMEAQTAKFVKSKTMFNLPKIPEENDDGSLRRGDEVKQPVQNPGATRPKYEDPDMIGATCLNYYEDFPSPKKRSPAPPVSPRKSEQSDAGKVQSTPEKLEPDDEIQAAELSPTKVSKYVDRIVSACIQIHDVCDHVADTLPRASAVFRKLARVCRTQSDYCYELASQAHEFSAFSLNVIPLTGRLVTVVTKPDNNIQRIMIPLKNLATTLRNMMYVCATLSAECRKLFVMAFPNGDESNILPGSADEILATEVRVTTRVLTAIAKHAESASDQLEEVCKEVNTKKCLKYCRNVCTVKMQLFKSFRNLLKRP